MTDEEYTLYTLTGKWMLAERQHHLAVLVEYTGPDPKSPKKTIKSWRYARAADINKIPSLQQTGEDDAK